jgi:hypothetical protein
MRPICEVTRFKDSLPGYTKRLAKNFHICLREVVIVVKKYLKALHCSNLKSPPWVNISCQKSNYQFSVDNCRYFMDTRTLSYRGNACQTEMTKKGQIPIARIAPAVWDMFWKSHGFQPVDMLVFIAGTFNLRSYGQISLSVIEK